MVTSKRCQKGSRSFMRSFYIQLQRLAAASGLGLQLSSGGMVH